MWMGGWMGGWSVVCWSNLILFRAQFGFKSKLEPSVAIRLWKKVISLGEIELGRILYPPKSFSKRYFLLIKIGFQKISNPKILWPKMLRLRLGYVVVEF